MPASIANIAFLTALFFCQPMKINDAGLPGSIQPPWLEGDAEQQAFQFETEGFYSLGKVEISRDVSHRALCRRLERESSLPVPTSASQSNPVLGTATVIRERPINSGPPGAVLG